MAIIKRKPVKKFQDFPFPHYGSLLAPCYMILDPVVGNLNARSPLSSEQAEWLFSRIKTYTSFKREDVCIISCAPPVDSETWQSNKLVSAHLKEHRQTLVNLLTRNKPKFVMTLGAKATQQVIGRSVQITKVRGQAVQEPMLNLPILPMLSTFYAQRQPETEATFVADLRTASRIHEAGYNVEASAIDYKHDYQWCYDLDFLIKLRPQRLSVDIESVGLIPFSSKTTVLTVQFTWEAGKSVIVPVNYDYGKYRHHNFIPWDTINRKRLLGQIKQLVEDPRIEKIGQNLKFDVQMFHYQMGIELANYAHDTMLASHLIDENQRRINIDDLVRRYVPEMAGFNDNYNNDPEHHGKSRMDLLTPPKMLEYGCGDTDAALRLIDRLLPILDEDPQLRACYDLVTMPAQRAFCEIERNGFPVSRERLVDFEHELRMHQKRERGYLLNQIPKTIRDKWRNSGVGLKVTRRDLLADWLYHHKDGLRLTPVAFTKTKLPSVSSKQALPHYVADYPVLARLVDYIKNDKMLNTYAKGFHKYIYNGIIRSTYKLASTVTGRSASADPNGQNFPKRGPMAKKYRRIFVAPKGWVFISLDLSQAELRIAAMMSGDENMMRVYRSGGDIHRMTAAGTMGITLEEFLKLDKETQALKRFQAKAVNFGFLYGMWWVKFRQYAKTEYGIDFTEAEAKNIREMFFKTYPRLQDWHEYVQDYVSQTGYIRTYDGRVRHLPNVFSSDESIAKQAMRQAINSPVQSIASDLGLMTLGRLIPHIKQKGWDEWLKPCGFIHDAIVCLVREDKVALGCATVKQFMENNPLEQWFGWKPSVPIIADAEIGRDLATTYELDKEWFEGSNKDKSYVDLLEDVWRDAKHALAKAGTEGEQKKLQSTIDKIEADAMQSGPLRFTLQRPSRKIAKPHGAFKHAKASPSRLTQGRSINIRQSQASGQGGAKLGKPRKDSAA